MVPHSLSFSHSLQSSSSPVGLSLDGEALLYRCLGCVDTCRGIDHSILERKEISSRLGGIHLAAGVSIKVFTNNLLRCDCRYGPDLNFSPCIFIVDSWVCFVGRKYIFLLRFPTVVSEPIY